MHANAKHYYDSPTGILRSEELLSFSDRVKSYIALFISQHVGYKDRLWGLMFKDTEESV